MIKLGSNSISKIYLGSNSIGKAYLGSSLVFQGGATPLPPSLIYSLQSAITTQNYDTGVKLFNTPKSFTILCEATFNNYDWTGTTRTQGVIGISTGDYFRFGAIASANGYVDGESVGTTNYYTALIMNNTSSTKMCTGLYSRNNGSLTRRFAITYDSRSRIISGFNDSTTGRWYTVSGDLSSEYTLKLLIGGASGTISVLEIYNGVLDGTTISDFIID